MTFKKLTPKQIYIMSIAPNEEIMETLNAFVKEQNINSGYLMGIGAVKSTRVAHYSVTTKKYTERKIKKPFELTNLMGIITSDKIHVHATYSNQLMRGYAGHLVKAVVAAACEIVVVETVEKIERKHDESIGLELLNLEHE
jgi:predicted DNA-binding protein with PD1-like motif